LRQIDQPPTDHAVNRRDRAAFDDLKQPLPVRVGEKRRVARRLGTTLRRRLAHRKHCVEIE
jgi:hypothetical protein